MNEQIERVGSHMANSIWQAISGMGKKELAKKARAVYYQMIADEAQLRAAYYSLQKLGAAPRRVEALRNAAEPHGDEMTASDYLKLIAARDAAWERLESGDRSAEDEYRQLQAQVEAVRRERMQNEATA